MGPYEGGTPVNGCLDDDNRRKVPGRVKWLRLVLLRMTAGDKRVIVIVVRAERVQRQICRGNEVFIGLQNLSMI